MEFHLLSIDGVAIAAPSKHQPSGCNQPECLVIKLFSVEILHGLINGMKKAAVKPPWKYYFSPNVWAS